MRLRLKEIAVYLVLAGVAISIPVDYVYQQEAQLTRDGVSCKDKEWSPVSSVTGLVWRLPKMLVGLGAVLFFLLQGKNELGGGYLFLIACLFIDSLYLFLKGEGPPGWLSYRFYSLHSPGFVIASLLFFMGASKEYWPRIIDFIVKITVLISIVVFIQMFFVTRGSRTSGYQHMYTFSLILEATAMIPIAWLMEKRKIKWVLAVCAPIALIFCAICEQARFLIIVTGLLVTTYLFMIRGAYEQKTRYFKIVWVFCLTVVLAVFVIFFLKDTFGDKFPLSTSMDAFWDRRMDDTRSGQFFKFFEYWSPQDVTWGRGVPRYGEASGGGSFFDTDEPGIDNGYVNMMFIGGVPLIVLYFLMYILPAVKTLRTRVGYVDAACAAGVLVYAVRLLSSTVPYIAPWYYILLLMMGRCAALVSEKRSGERTHVFRANTSVGTGK